MSHLLRGRNRKDQDNDPVTTATITTCANARCASACTACSQLGRGEGSGAVMSVPLAASPTFSAHIVVPLDLVNTVATGQVSDGLFGFTCPIR
jgi:hypothetical protein